MVSSSYTCLPELIAVGWCDAAQSGACCRVVPTVTTRHHCRRLSVSRRVQVLAVRCNSVLTTRRRRRWTWPVAPGTTARYRALTPRRLFAETASTWSVTRRRRPVVMC